MTVAQTIERSKENVKKQVKQVAPGKPAALERLQGLLPQTLTHEGVVLERHLREGRFQRSLAAITALSGLFTGLEVGYEHYRGSYGQRIMYTPFILSFALAIAGTWTALRSGRAHTVLRIVSLITIIDGAIGFIFHIRGIARKPGGWRIPVFNLIMGPPLFAPLLFATVGFLGLITSFLRRESAPEHPLPHLQRQRFNWLPQGIQREEALFQQEIREGRFQRMLGIVTAISTLFSWIEALYSHYKNNFTYSIQWSPLITAVPLMIAGIGTVWSRRMAQVFLPIASLIAMINGVIGFGYHVRGVLRRSGGTKKLLYNILYGPPIFAPLIFAASGFIGLLTSLLRRENV